VTWSVKVAVSATLGVQEIVMVALLLAFNASPAGRDPSVIAQVNGAAAPPAVMTPL